MLPVYLTGGISVFLLLGNFFIKDKGLETLWDYRYNKTIKEGCQMKKHKFWAWAAIICMAMSVYTGYRHK